MNYVASTDSGAGGGSSNEEDRVTKWSYNGLNRVTNLTAVNVTSSGTVNQITDYQYADAADASLASIIKYPDQNTTDSSHDYVEMTYNLDGSLATKTDQRGVVMTYTYDDARRLKREGATTLPGSVDGSIKSIERTYDGLGRVATITSNSAADGSGSVRNQIKNSYHSMYGYVQKSEQSHEGVVGMSTPAVTYQHDDSVTSNVFDDALRLDWVLYPGASRKIQYAYGSSGTSTNVSDRLNRVFNISDITGTTNPLTYYFYNGISRLIATSYSSPSINLDYFGGASGTYAGFDRFGRIIDQYWYRSVGGTTDIDRFKYGYDYASDRKWREDIVAGNQSTPVHLDEFYSYDSLHRLTNFTRGNLTGDPPTGTSGSYEVDWTLDQLGNWAQYYRTGTSDDLDQSRKHNAVNEIDVDIYHSNSAGTSITAASGTNWYDPKYDAAGNLTEMPSATSLNTCLYLTYDAWNRLVKTNDGEDIDKIEYDGMHRRIVRDEYGPDHHYYYNEHWQLLEERINTGTNPEGQFVWHPYYIDALAVRYWDSDRDGELDENDDGDHYYIHDANYNVTSVVDSSGNVLERYSYTPYGTVTFLNSDFTVRSVYYSSIGNRHLYTGRERDDVTHLQLNRNRYYCSWLGQWLTRDPIGYDGGTNLYQYVLSRPLISVDPSGNLVEAPVVIGGGVSAGEVIGGGIVVGGGAIVVGVGVGVVGGACVGECVVRPVIDEPLTNAICKYWYGNEITDGPGRPPKPDCKCTCFTKSGDPMKYRGNDTKTPRGCESKCRDRLKSDFERFSCDG